MEEGFDEGVVGHFPGAIHALNKPELGNALLEVARRVLGSPISVEDHTRSRLALVHGSIQGSERERHIFVWPVGPADHPAAVLVHHDSQIAVDASDLEVGDVAHPDLVGALELEIELLVGDACVEPLQSRTRIANRGHASLDPVSSHETGNPMLADAMAAALERSMHSWTSIGTAAFAMHRADLGRQGIVVQLAPAATATAPGIETSPGYSVEPAHRRDLVLRPVYFDELEDFRFRPEANRMAFFRSSCSSLSTL